LQQLNIETSDYTVIADEVDAIQSTLKKYVEDNYDLVIFTGGTGLSQRDNTPDAIKPLIEKEIPGVMETARNYGQQRMAFAMLSRGIAGFFKNTLVLTLPGSVRGVEETMDALFPQVLHVFKVREKALHE
jgi:molybdenum cofactor synthesis domain-containing protein